MAIDSKMLFKTLTPEIETPFSLYEPVGFWPATNGFQVISDPKTGAVVESLK